jgi:hypothetical protein
MLKLDIAGIIFFYILSSAMTLLIVWAVLGYKGLKSVSPKDIEYIWKCSVCFNTYLDSRHEDISVCPLCGSYNKKACPTAGTEGEVAE